MPGRDGGHGSEATGWDANEPAATSGGPIPEREVTTTRPAATPTPPDGDIGDPNLAVTTSVEAGLTDERLTARLIAKSPGENFPVASRLLPARVRADLMALYAYARLVDDLGDEAPGDRERLLDTVAADLARVYADQPATLPVLRRLSTTISAHGIPAGPFYALIDANRQDQRVTRYATYDDLVDYCVRSANPVGQVVLRVFDKATPERAELSDRICTALQIAEHLQDVAEDYRAGRIYLPREDLDRFGCTEDDLGKPVATPRVRRLIAFERRRALALLDSGTPLVETLPGFARLAVAGYVAGGRAALAAIAAAADDVLRDTPRPARPRLLREWLGLLARGGRA